MVPGRTVTPTDGGKGLTLALNTAEGILQIAFAGENGHLVYSLQIDAASRGVEIMTPALESALAMLDARASDIARIAVVNGPGSFTGLRLAVTTAAGLARAVGALQAPIGYMPLLALQSLPFSSIAGEEAHIWILARARRDLVYIQAFARSSADAHGLRQFTDIAVLPVSSGEAARHILNTGILLKSSNILLAGSGVQANRDVLVEALTIPGAPRVTILPIVSPQPDTLLAAALGAQYTDADIDVAYARQSDAEENLPRIAGRLGLNPDAAVKKLRELTTSLPGE